MAVKPKTSLVIDTPEYAARHTLGASETPATPAEVLLDIPLNEVCPRPGFNQRKRFDEAALTGLAESIHSQGVQQPIVVRSCEPIPHEKHISPTNDAAQLYDIFGLTKGRTVEQVVGKEAADERVRQLSECRYHIVMGERRWRASLIAGKATIPAIVRDGLDDNEYKVRALLENIQRENLDPIEEAEGYRELAAMGYTQEQIGEMVGRGQTGIAKALRLLKLPEDVQALLRAGKLSVAHGLAILRFERFPAVMSLIAENAVETLASSKALEKHVPFVEALRAKKLLVSLHTFDAKFDIKAICPQCPFDAYRQHAEYYPVCLNPTHYDQLQAEAQVKLQEKLREASEASRLRAEEALRKAQAAQAAAATKADKERAQKEVSAAQKAVKTVKDSLPKMRDLRHGTYAEIDGSCPPECTAACPCRSKAMDYTGKPVDICVEPGRMNRFKAAHNRDEQKERRARFDELRAQITSCQTAQPDTRGLALIALRYLTSHESGKTDALKATRLPENASGDLVALMGGTHRLDDNPRYWTALASLSAGQIINLLTEVMLRQEMHQAHEYKSDAIPATAWWMKNRTVSNNRVRVKTYVHSQEVFRQGTRLSFAGGFVTVLLDGETSPTSYDANDVQALPAGLAPAAEAPSAPSQPLPDCVHCGNTIGKGEGVRLDDNDQFTPSDNLADLLFCRTCKATLEGFENSVQVPAMDPPCTRCGKASERGNGVWLDKSGEVTGQNDPDAALVCLTCLPPFRADNEDWEYPQPQGRATADPELLLLHDGEAIIPGQEISPGQEEEVIR